MITNRNQGKHTFSAKYKRSQTAHRSTTTKFDQVSVFVFSGATKSTNAMSKFDDFCLLLLLTVILYKIASRLSSKNRGKIQKKPHEIIPKSVNYHFTRSCNYQCGFCFHTAKTSFILDLEDAKYGLKLLKQAGMEKINFSGGEPFLPQRGRFLGEMVKYCKQELRLPSVTVVSNGSLITEKWFEQFGTYLDIMAVSCDSFNDETNREIGRYQSKKEHLEQILRVREWCEKYNVLFKLNTVVNTYNKDEDMVENIKKINPIRWKVFQCLLLEGENAGPAALRNAERFYITNAVFEEFLERHKDIECLVPESNTKMQNSYLILDEYMRFLDCTSGAKIPSKSILDVGVANALKFSGFDEAMFKKRGGIYKWSKEPDRLSW